MTSKGPTAILALCSAAVDNDIINPATFARQVAAAIKMLAEAAEIIRARCPRCAKGDPLLEWASGVFVHTQPYGISPCGYTDAERAWLAQWDSKKQEKEKGTT